MDHLRVYLYAAVCACHINYKERGFRQKDVHFFFDLFSNWMDSHLGQKSQLQNTQIQRFMKQLVALQVLKQKTGRTPVYTCQDTGLLYLIEKVSRIEEEDDLELFFFQYHLLEIYFDLLFETLLQKKLELPHSLKIELKYLLDREVLWGKQYKRIQKKIDMLKIRTDEAQQMEKLALKLYDQGKSEEIVIKTIEHTLPYQLNHQMKMSALYEKLLPGLRKRELTSHTRKRVQSLWHPMLNFYLDYLNRLETLKRNDLC
jgi:hypothetical protein